VFPYCANVASNCSLTPTLNTLVFSALGLFCRIFSTDSRETAAAVTASGIALLFLEVLFQRFLVVVLVVLLFMANPKTQWALK